MVEYHLPNSKLTLNKLNKLQKEFESKQYIDIEKSEYHRNKGNDYFK